jgi:hypothetical protein
VRAVASNIANVSSQCRTPNNTQKSRTSKIDVGDHASETRAHHILH